MYNMMIYDVKWEIGAHTSFEKRICDTIWTGVNYGMYTVQFFMGNPYGFDRSKITYEDLTESRHILNRFPMSVFTHFPYVSNLAGSKDVLAWDGDKIQDGKTSHIIKSLEYELGVIAQLGVKKSGVVIHPGNFPHREKGLEAISKSINRINFNKGSKLILENSAGQGVSLATTFREIGKIIDGVTENKRDNVGVCIDTCHIYAYGDYDLSEERDVDRMFRDFEECIGIDKLSLIHLNDSQNARNSRKDRHACLGEGCIWKECNRSLVYLLERCDKIGVPMVLETDISDMKVLSGLVKEL